MNRLTLEKVNSNVPELCDSIDKYIGSYLKDQRTAFFDIHNTIEYDYRYIDKDVANFIIQNHKKLNIVLLSYEKKGRTIKNNDKLLIRYSNIFRQLPRIYIKQRRKHHIIACVYHSIVKKYGSAKNMVFVDDGIKNAVDGYKIKNRLISNLDIILYLKHAEHKHDTEYATYNIKPSLQLFLDKDISHLPGTE
jgi:hypothetical protein